MAAARRLAACHAVQSVHAVEQHGDLLGHWMEMRSVSRAQGALQELATLLPDEAERISDGAAQRVALSHLRGGDVVLVRRGARVPAGGEVTEGASSVACASRRSPSEPLSSHQQLAW